MVYSTEYNGIGIILSNNYSSASSTIKNKDNSDNIAIILRGGCKFDEKGL